MLRKSCKNCQQPLHWKKIRFKESIWPCTHCDAEHPLLETVLTPENLGYKDKITQAKGVNIERESPLQIRVSARTKGNGRWFLFFGGLIAFFSYKGFFVSGAQSGFYLFCGLLFLLGAGLLYLAANRLFISHHISVAGRQLLLKTQLPGGITLKQQAWTIEDATQFFVIGNQEMESDHNDINYVVFNLAFQQQQETQPIMFLRGLRDYQTAFFLERTLERALDIEDAYVKGEFVPYADLLHLGFLQKGFKAFRWLRWLQVLRDD